MTVHDLLPRLPTPDLLRERCRAFAVLDTVFEPHFRTHTFEPEWETPNVSLAGMDNGSGDHYVIVFKPAGAFLFGFDHEAEATPWRVEPRAHWPGLLDGLPASFAPYTREPAFLFENFFDATVCAWYENDSAIWRCGPVDFTDLQGDVQDPDGAEHLFELLADGTAEAYASFAEDCFEVKADIGAVTSVLSGRPLSAGIVTTLNPGADFRAIAAEVAAMGFPVDEFSTEAPKPVSS